jgi:hypothetical protein
VYLSGYASLRGRRASSRLKWSRPENLPNSRVIHFCFIRFWPTFPFLKHAGFVHILPLSYLTEKTAMLQLLFRHVNGREGISSPNLPRHLGEDNKYKGVF